MRLKRGIDLTDYSNNAVDNDKVVQGSQLAKARTHLAVVLDSDHCCMYSLLL